MDHIIDAVSRAKAARKQQDKPKQEHASKAPGAGAAVPSLAHSGVNGRWTCPGVMIDPAHLEKHRIVSYEARDPSHMAFNVLRTKIYQSIRANSWRSLAITSPSTNCGKTMVAVNLAFSMARQNNCRTVLIDLDLRRSSVAETLGVQPESSIGNYLDGSAELQQCFVQATDTLYFGLNLHGSNRVFELAQHQRVEELIPNVVKGLEPDVIIVDLPPLLSNDEVMSVLPLVDASMLIAAAGKTTAEQIEDCQVEFKDTESFLGVVLNKCSEQPEEYYY